MIQCVQRVRTFQEESPLPFKLRKASNVLVSVIIGVSSLNSQASEEVILYEARILCYRYLLIIGSSSNHRLFLTLYRINRRARIGKKEGELPPLGGRR